MLAPTGRDAELMCAVLGEAGVRCVSCRDMRELCHSMREGAAAVIIAEEALGDGAYRDLSGVLAQEPPWSDPPILLLSERGADSPVITEALETLGNVTVLERPTRVPTLVSAVHSALRSRGRQYQIRAHIAERERYADALRAADRRKDEFLATLAHELRNPLAPMTTALEIMHLAPRDDAAREQSQAVLARQLKQMTRLIDDLLDLSRISHGKLELRREQVSLSAVVESAIEITRPAIEAQGHTLHVDLPTELVYLHADATRLSQVFSNLLHNACKYTEYGGTIHISAVREGEHVSVRVKDNGVGIDREDLQRVFEMFTQVGRSIEQSRGGLGVGLALSQWLVRLHGGTIHARSEGRSHGSEFVVRLPVVAAPVLGRASGERQRRAKGASGHRILIVDDNRDFADSLAAVVRHAGNEVCVTYDGLEAVGAVGTWRPDIILLDIGLPLLNGYDTARRIRDTLGKRNPLLVAITGWGQEEDRRRSRAAGFDHHLVKPIDPAALITFLAAAFAAKEIDGHPRRAARATEPQTPALE
jgi:signal transduction histidine kinase/AmiR/NasT family two-component response regulator